MTDNSTNPFENTKDSEQHTDVQNIVPTPLSYKKNASKVTNMSVGDVRQCFQQMRNTPDLRSSTVLWCGVTAGQFALAYLLQTAHSSSRRRRSKHRVETQAV